MERLTRVKEVEEDVFEVVPYFECEEIINLDEFDLLEWQEEIYNKLAEFENTGLQPSEVVELQQENAVLKKALEIVTKDQFPNGKFETARKQKYDYYIEKAKIKEGNIQNE